MKYFFVFTLLCLFLLNSEKLYSQDVSFSQFYSNRLYLNPSLAGVEKDVRRVFVNYRNQWPGIGKTYVTYSASYDQYIEELNGGIGVRLFNDIAGDGTFKEYSMSLDYSYHLKVSRELDVNFGLEAGFVQKSVSPENLIFGDMINPATGQIISGSTENFSTQNKAFPDFSAGISGFFRDFYGGISMAHLLKPSGSVSNSENSRIPRRFTAFAGALIPVYERRLGKEVLQLSPNLIYQQQNAFKQINYGLEGQIDNQLIIGIWLRQNVGIRINSIIFSGGYVTESFRIRYSYDRHLSSPTVKLPGLGAHEISLVLTIGNVKKIKRKAIKCPKI